MSRLLPCIIQGVWLFWFRSPRHKTKVFTFFEMKNFTPTKTLSYLEKNRIALKLRCPAILKDLISIKVTGIIPIYYD